MNKSYKGMQLPFFKKLTAEWCRRPDEINELVWHAPNDVFPKIGNIREIIVKEHERAFLVTSGVLKKFLTPGKHPKPKDVNEIIWVDVSPKNCPFGVAKYRGLVSADDKKIGLSGVITLRVSDREEDVKTFIRKVVAGRKSLNLEQLIDWLREGSLTSVFRGVVSRLTFAQLTRMERDELINLVLPILTDELSKCGIDVCSIDRTGIADSE